MKEWIVEGNIWKVGNNINTESIVASRWHHEGEKALMQHIGELLIPEFPQKVQKGDIWAAGTNLGCSSSRNAPAHMKTKGLAAVICGSAARTFYRNCINSGLPIFEIGKDADKINMGDKVRVNVKTGEIKNLTTGAEIKAHEFPDFIMELLEAGSIKKLILSRKSQYKYLK
jgi:3-isopropylmalate/(R)-2-methylmalate dehydratase small subunit